MGDPILPAVDVVAVLDEPTSAAPSARRQSRLRESAQGDKWSFCLTAGKI
jgi:hypothetical protein